jgi:hypothetical protein
MVRPGHHRTSTEENGHKVEGRGRGAASVLGSRRSGRRPIQLGWAGVLWWTVLVGFSWATQKSCSGIFLGWPRAAATPARA